MAASAVPATLRMYRPGFDANPTLRVFQHAVLETASADYDASQVAAWAGVGSRDVSDWDDGRVAAHTFVAVISAQVAGFADFTDEGVVDMLFVDPRFARRGISRQLIAHVKAQARGAGLSALTTFASRTACPAFERLGLTTLTYRPDNCVRDVVVPNYEMRCDLLAV